MRSKYLISSLVLILLAGLMTGLILFPAFAEGNEVRIIQLSPSGLGRAHTLAYSPDGETLAVGSSLGIHLFDSSDLQLLKFIPTDTWVRALAFSPDGSLLASGSYDKNIRIWRTRDGTLLKELTGHSAWVRSLAFSPDGQWLATASDDNTVRLWSIPDGKLLQIFDKSMEGLRTLTISPDGTILATGGYDKIIRLWQIPDGTLLRELTGHTDWVRALAFSPDGVWLASGAFDATVRLWRVTDGELVVTRKEHSSSVLGVAFSPDGSLLASASVDSSVRLWKMPQLDPYDLLKGHSDFVFSVDFSPDGKTLASGSVDNTVRVWAVPTNPNPGAQELVTTPSNCQACHHPLPFSRPARVIEASCETCHSNGSVAAYWCTNFPRSGGNSLVKVISQINPDELGVPLPNQNVAVTIANYGNGEYLYSRGDVVSRAPLSGHVYYPEGDVTSVNVQLEITGGGHFEVLHTTPNEDGVYRFDLSLSPQGAEPSDLSSSDGWRRSECLSCHDKVLKLYPSLPQGNVKLTITATTPNGEEAVDVRWITVDESSTAIIPVEVIREDGQFISNIPVEASTFLYEWRGRSFLSTSDASGRASLQVEALSQYPTTYQISVPPTVIDGMLYESKESIEIVLPPGAITAPLVTVHVQAAQGEIHGQVSGLSSPIVIKAISLPGGATHVVTTSPQGIFTFSDLPVGQYLVVADLQALAKQGLTLRPKSIDLAQSLSVEANLTPRSLEGSSMHGKVTDESGTSLPFAWIKRGSQIGKVDPASGTYTLFGIFSNEATAIISAPGYYSEAHHVDPATNLDFSLIRRPETMLIPWGDGTVVIPPETVAVVKGQTINFEQGWIWGAGESAEPLVINWNDMRITTTGARFALERSPAQSTWLYVMDGEASIQQGSATSPMIVRAGEMVLLDPAQRYQPYPYDATVVQALHMQEAPVLNLVWQPSLSAQIRDRLAQAGVGTAQFMTFITYLMALLTLLVFPIIVIKWSSRSKKEREHD